MILFRLWLLFVIPSPFGVKGCKKLKLFWNKRLGNDAVIERHIVTSHGRCTALCHDKNRCYAVNVIETNHIVCELSTGLSSEEEMVDDTTSFLYVLDYNKCAEEPKFCLNDATCERTLTSARCHCTDRYQGDRCDNCTERFQADDCDECADGYYGNSCETSFTSHPGKLCNVRHDQFIIGTAMPADDSGYYDNCKKWCVARSDCDGFIVAGETCFFANKNCRTFGLARSPDLLIFLEEIN